MYRIVVQMGIMGILMALYVKKHQSKKFEIHSFMDICFVC